MTQFGWPMLLANFRECQRSALDGNRGEEVVAILFSPYYRPWNGKWEEIMNGWSATPSKITSLRSDLVSSKQEHYWRE